ncbi:MAG TPA: RNA polymerase sigma factor [Solirubrobacteraceae bacterium]|jgi:RNA polymerase sigma-70 factor (ECF subfamily)|nr:RNA polymerase sigma factor [Solirubrobacteraceae bacterium]
MTADRSDESLLLGSPEDFGAFYARAETAILAYFRSRVAEPELAADLTAECFALALKGRRRFDSARGPARAWLFGIAGHVLSRSVRHRRVEDRARRRLRMEPIEIDDAALDRVEELDGADVAALALEGLPEAQREAVRARILLEQPYELIAERLSCSEAVARKRVSRGLAAIRTVLKEDVS